jgi:hypothetical protein
MSAEPTETWPFAAVLLAVFMLVGYSGYITPAHSTVAIEVGIWLSGLFWFVSAAFPLWRRSDFASAYFNTLAAAAAVYAGIAALQ